MSQDELPIRRRTVLRGAATAGLALGGLTATAAAEEHCCTCWVDVKPDSCPNSVNPNNRGVVSVAAGQPDFESGSVELLPISEDCAEGFDPAFDRCQDYQDPQFSRDCESLRELESCARAEDDRSASPVRSTTEDINDDGTQDSVFKFETQDLDLRADDAYLLLVGTQDGCETYGIDSVRVVDRGRGSGSSSGGRGDGNGRSNGNGGGNGRGRGR